MALPVAQTNTITLTQLEATDCIYDAASVTIPSTVTAMCNFNTFLPSTQLSVYHRTE